MEIDSEDKIETIAENILIGLGANTEANRIYLVLHLEELVTHVVELCAEKALKMGLSKKSTSPDDNRDTIEL